MNPNLEILVASHNSGKVREIKDALSSLPLTLHDLNEFPEVAPIEEVGQTYRDNALLKALGYSMQTQLWALADDSGLEVDALGGQPGVYSARWGGEHSSDSDRINKLLGELRDQSTQQRTARFVCCMALARFTADAGPAKCETELVHVTEGICEGMIAFGPRGNNGFGFDPVFIPAGGSHTFAELGDEVKSQLSHRAIALQAMHMFLERLIGQT